MFDAEATNERRDGKFGPRISGLGRPLGVVGPYLLSHNGCPCYEATNERRN